MSYVCHKNIKGKPNALLNYIKLFIFKKIYFRYTLI